MRKSKIYISSIIIFPLLLGFFVTASADAQDFSGNWNGKWYCNVHKSGGGLYLNLTQNGTIVTGTLSISDWAYVVQNWGITGTITGNALSFKSTETSGGYNFVFNVSQALLTNNQLSGYYTIYRNGEFFCDGNFNAARSASPPVTYTINASAGIGGSITNPGSISVFAGATQCFYIFPNDGYKIVDVIVDGVSVGAKNSYTFDNVSANHTIMVTFKKAPKTMPWLPLILED
jgi:hypothetical protein